MYRYLLTNLVGEDFGNQGKVWKIDSLLDLVKKGQSVPWGGKVLFSLTAPDPRSYPVCRSSIEGRERGTPSILFGFPSSPSAVFGAPSPLKVERPSACLTAWWLANQEEIKQWRGGRRSQFGHKASSLSLALQVLAAHSTVQWKYTRGLIAFLCPLFGYFSSQV